jgi:uncharacterized repeat protein (TIGR03943 family)
VSPVDASRAVLATGLLALWMGLTDAMLKYLKPSMRPWLVLAGALLVAVGIRGFVRARRQADDGHTHRQGVGWLLIAPILVVLILGQQSLGAFAASRSNTRNLPPYSFDIEGYAIAHGQEIPDLQLVDVYLGSSQRGNREYLAQHAVRLRGFVTHSTALGKHGFVLNRFLVSCCAADATPIRLGIIGADAVPKVGRWVEVTAHLEPGYPLPAGASGVPTAVMHVHGIKAIDEPSGPYETLR